MKARIRSTMYSLEFSGSPAIWNDFFRPLVGGPRAPDEPAEPDEAAPAAAPTPGRPHDAGRPVLTPAPLRPTPFAAPGRLAPGSDRPYPDDSFSGGGYRDRGDDRGGRERNFEPRRGHDGDRGGDRFGRGGAPQRGPAPARPAPADGGAAHKPRRVRPQAVGPDIEKTSDPAELYERLGGVDGRRGEKDAVLAAVWFTSKGERFVTAEEVEKHLKEHGWEGDVRVRPHLQKHVTRSKTLDAGEEQGTFRTNRKGARYVQEMLIGD